MITSAERVMLATDFPTLRKLWIARSRVESGRIASDRDFMAQQGLEQVFVEPDQLLLADGREVVHAFGKAWAFTSVIHTNRLADYFEQRKKAQATPGEALTSVLCPACQSTMAKSPICPNCAKGKAGFKILCVCTECAHEVYL